MPEAGVADESIYGEWSRAAENEGCEAGDIQQIDLITRRSDCAPDAVTPISFIELKP
jgi:hypothetical protein